MGEGTNKRIVLGILAHVDAGKTTLSEGLLYRSGAIRTLGRVDHRDAHLDTHELERARGITIFSKQALLQSGDTAITLLDTPGHIDFSAETERTLQVLDYAILVISGTDGVQSHTVTLWKLLRRYRIPTFLFINKMDLPASERKLILNDLKKHLSEDCADALSEDFMEDAAVRDEALLERYMEEGALTDGDIATLIRHAITYSETHGVRAVDIMERIGCDNAAQVLAGAVYACLVSGTDFDRAMIVSVNHSGRSSAVGAITGAILGIRLGEEALPDFYIECLEPAEVLRELADDLHTGCPMERGNRLFDLDWDYKYLNGGQ